MTIKNAITDMRNIRVETQEGYMLTKGKINRNAKNRAYRILHAAHQDGDYVSRADLAKLKRVLYRQDLAYAKDPQRLP